MTTSKPRVPAQRARHGRWRSRGANPGGQSGNRPCARLHRNSAGRWTTRGARCGKCDHGAQPLASLGEVPAIKVDRNSPLPLKMKEPMKRLPGTRLCRRQQQHGVPDPSRRLPKSEFLPNLFAEPSWDDGFPLKRGPSLQEPVIR